MNLTELIDAVVVLTKRPDKADAILLAIQNATLFCHQFEFFRRDIVEVPVRFSAPLFKGAIDYGALLPGFRKIAYWRKFEPTTCTAGAYLRQVEADQLLDQFKNQKLDRFYLAGRVLNWLSSTSDPAHLIGYYKHPAINKSNYDSWIATDHPFAIVNLAAAPIFKSIGQPEEEKSSRAEGLSLLNTVLVNEIESEAR